MVKVSLLCLHYANISSFKFFKNANLVLSMNNIQPLQHAGSHVYTQLPGH